MRAPDELQKIWSDPQRLEKWTIKQLDACIVPKDIPGAIKMIERRWEELERKYRELERVYQQKGWPDAFRETVNEMRERMDAARKQKDAVRKKGAKINRAEQELLNWAAKVARGFGASTSAADPHLDAFNVLLGLPVPARDDLPKRGRPREGASKLDEAVADVARIRDLWQQTFGKRYRSQPPTAIEIAARRHGLASEQLVAFRKNKSRRSRLRISAVFIL